MKKYKKKFIASFITLLLLAIIGSIFIYIFAREPIERNREESIRIALSEAKLSEVSGTSWFHYMDSYTVVEGTTEDGTEMIVFVPDSDDEDLLIIKKDEGMTLKEAINLLYYDLDLSPDKRPKKVVGGKYGLVDRKPVYEITYIDQEGRHSILYIDFYKGEWFRVYNM